MSGIEQRLTVLTLGVSDLERSIAFYQALGWRRAVRDAEGVAFFQLGGIALSLFPVDVLASDSGVTFGGGGHAPVALAHNCHHRQDVDTTIATFVAAGARLVKPPVEAFWGGYGGYVADPDGYLWEIAWNPGFPLAGDGTVSLPE